jgi:hypothetical protein
MLDGSNEADPMVQYTRFVLTTLSIASVRVRADGTIVFALGEQTHEFAVGGVR